jgi:hypothetical protein
VEANSTGPFSRSNSLIFPFELVLPNALLPNATVATDLSRALSLARVRVAALRPLTAADLTPSVTVVADRMGDVAEAVQEAGIHTVVAVVPGRALSLPSADPPIAFHLVAGLPATREVATAAPGGRGQGATLFVPVVPGRGRYLQDRGAAPGPCPTLRTRGIVEAEAGRGVEQGAGAGHLAGDEAEVGMISETAGQDPLGRRKFNTRFFDNAHLTRQPSCFSHRKLLVIRPFSFLGLLTLLLFPAVTKTSYAVIFDS